MSLKYLIHFWRSLEMPLVNNKIDNNDANSYFRIQRHKLICSYSNFIRKIYQKLSKLFRKVLEKYFYSNEYKTKSANKTATNEYRYFRKPNFVGFNRLFCFSLFD